MNAHTSWKRPAPRSCRPVLSNSASWIVTIVVLLGLAVGSDNAVAAPAGYNGEWTRLAATGPQPPPDRDAGAVYDSNRDRLVAVAGGLTWALNLAEPAALWEQLPTAPLGYGDGFARAVYDAVGDRMVIVTATSQLFQLSLSNPVAWASIGVTTPAPPTRSFFAVAHDSFRNRLILYGGGPSTGYFNDLWAFDLAGSSGWSQIQPTGTTPPPTWGPLMIYDSTRDRLIIGTGATTTNPDVVGGLYSVDLTGAPAWTPLTMAGPPLSPRLLAGAIYDPGLQRMLVFGGYPAGTSEVWELELSGPMTGTVLTPAGSTPPARWSSNTLYRSAGPAMVIFSGHNGADFTDTWSLSSSITTAPPEVGVVSPSGGRVGDAVTILGAWLETVTEVRFNGVLAPIFSQGFEQLLTQVPTGATSGPITVTNPFGTGTSPQPFFVGELPVVSTAEPESARAGEEIIIRGLHLSSATLVRFGGTGGVQPTVLSDTELRVVLDTLGTSGPITVTSLVGSGTSAFTFLVLHDDPRPRLLSVQDVASDQGGLVVLRWRASDFDQPKYKLITGYRVWRRAPANVGSFDARSLPRGWLATRAPGSAASDPYVFWESLVDLPAAFLRGYAYAAATLQDSTEDSNPYTAFFVQALTADPFEFHGSSPDSGYSVDNLAPPTPAPFTAHYGPAANTLHWRIRATPDLREFQIHRGLSPTFVPNESSLLATTRDTNYVDGAGSYFYKLAAIDIHGNRSRFASLAPDQPVATLAAFLRAERVSGRVRVIWFSGGNPDLPANVYRRTADTEWQFQRLIIANGSGYLNFDDLEVEDATRYAYRLGITEPDGEELSLGETWVDPLATTFAWIGVPANPSTGGHVSLSLALPAGASADVRLYDIAGREVEAIELAAGSGGTRSAQFGASTRLRPGVYLVRATRGAEVLQRRVVVLN